MTFVRRTLLVFCSVLVLGGLVPTDCRAQTGPASAQDSVVTSNASAGTQQAYTLPPEKMAKAIALSRIRNILDIAGTIWRLLVLWMLLATRAIAAIEAWVERVLRQRWQQGLLFFALFFVITTLAGLPIDTAGHHFSRAYGISVQGWGGWLGDQGKGLGLTVVIGSLVLLLLNWIVRRWPRRYWFGAWLAVVPLIVLGTFLEPLAEPIFYNYEPLSQNHAALVADLEKVVARTSTEIPPNRMFLMKASEKTNGLNAYVDGIGATKRIVVWDTTAGRIPDDEIMFIFGHESGHYVLNHIPKGMAITAVALFFMFWGCAGLGDWMARRFGAGWGVKSQDSGAAPLASRTGFVVLIFAVSLAVLVVQPVGNAVSRHFEHEADVYGQEAIHGLVPDPQKTAVAAFNALGEAWLEDPDPSPFMEFWEYNHPSVKSRANFAAHYDPWRDGGHGEFF
ncbi:MAG: M48 family metallopeptidase [Terracidiphilus sp.]